MRTFRNIVGSVAVLSMLVACGGSQEPGVELGPTTTAPPEPVAPATTQAALEHHLKAFNERNMADLLAGYAGGATLISPMGTLRGIDQIEGLFSEVFAEFSAPGSTFEVLEQLVKDDVAFLMWKAETAEGTYEMGTETFVFKDGKIAFHTVAFKLASKLGKPVAAPSNPGPPAYPAPGSTASVVLHHLDAFSKGDLEGLLGDYAETATLLTATGEVPHAALGDAFRTLLAEFAEPGARSSVLYMAFEDEVGVVVWAAETSANVYELAADTFIVRNGKIVAQTFGALIEPKTGQGR